MLAFTKRVLEMPRSINDISQELMFATDGDDSKREDVLLATVQELANAILAIQNELKFRN